MRNGPILTANEMLLLFRGFSLILRIGGSMSGTIDEICDIYKISMI